MNPELQTKYIWELDEKTGDLGLGFEVVVFELLDEGVVLEDLAGKQLRPEGLVVQVLEEEGG
jgi:hypothetical protein